MFRFSLTASVLFFCACTGPDITPVQYNDSLVIEQVRVVEAADRLQEVFDTYVKEDMESVYGRFTVQIDRSIEKVKQIDAFKGDAAFKNSTMDLLSTYKRLSENQYGDAMELLSKPDSLYSPSDEARLELLYKQIDRVTNQAGNNYSKAQDDFAKANNLKLSPVTREQTDETAAAPE